MRMGNNWLKSLFAKYCNILNPCLIRISLSKTAPLQTCAFFGNSQFYRHSSKGAENRVPATICVLTHLKVALLQSWSWLLPLATVPVQIPECKIF